MNIKYIKELGTGFSGSVYLVKIKTYYIILIKLFISSILFDIKINYSYYYTSAYLIC